MQTIEEINDIVTPETPNRSSTDHGKVMMEFDRRKYRKEGRAAFNAAKPLSFCLYSEKSEAYSGWHVGYEGAKADAQLGVKAHGIGRDEWERRFKARIAGQLELSSEADPSWTMVPATELASWPEQDEHQVAGHPPEWMSKLPELAADENLRDWTY